MRDGSRGKYGSHGNGESATYRFQTPPEGSNPTLTAIFSLYVLGLRQRAPRALSK